MKFTSQESMSGRVRAYLQSVSVTFLVTMLALPANAYVAFPAEPLQSSGRIPPNILFVLDDSGSMEYTRMPDNVPSTSTLNIAMSAYTRNTIYYNPYTDYKPWLQANGSPMTGGLNYGAVYSSVELASGATTNLYAGTQTFYVPKDPGDPSSFGDAKNYWRYQIHTDGRVVQSEYLQGGSYPEGETGRGCSSGMGGTTWRWKNCTFTTPIGRNEADERANFAVWYSYHRTRMKVAKAGTGRAFSELGENMRVGFRTIHARTMTGNPITFGNPFRIVDTGNPGLFLDDGSITNKSTWYARLYGATASGNTPLRDALNKAGILYRDNDTSTGPYGPEIGVDQFSCRQNFTLLTTDGYRNDSGYSNSVGEVDSVNGPSITNGGSYQYTPSPPYTSTYSDSLADIAMYYWNRDLRPDLGNNVPTSSADPAFWQHMTTFAISIGAAGTLDPSTDLPGLTSGAISWPSPDNNTSRSIDDLWHASINGHGSFVLANDADEFTNALRAALAAITERTGSFANVSTNSTQVNAGAEIFQARFISGKWTGELNSYPITGLTVSSTPSWNASAGIPATGRNIITYNGVTGATFPTSSQIAALVRTDSPSVSGADNAAYIAGDRSLEIGNGGTLRDRNHLLGDIVHSSPAYDRGTDVVYVGANDGMLHAFDADDGSEVFAYVPGGISIPDLATLSDPDYEHRYFVDGPISISRRSQTPAQSVLVGALGRGGKGIYSLDVTHPNTFDDSDVRWERTETPGLNMGQVLGQPIIAKLNNGQVGVIVPNGVNSQNERAVLLVYALNGTLLAEIDTGEGSSAQPNGLMAATTRDIDGNGTVDYVFAGDLSGNLWKFNLSSASTTAWASASNRLLMFTAVNADGERQPITSAPALARDPNTYELWVFFGTGRFMSLDDVSNHEVQSLYGIKDGMTAVTSRSLQLQQRNIIVAGTAANGSAIRGFEPHGYLDESKRGWYIDLLTPPNPPGTPEGERVVSDIQVIASTFIASTIIPDMDPCLPGGTGFINALDAFSGTSLTTSFFDIDGDGFYSDETIDPGTGLPVSVGSIDPSVGMPSLPAILNNLAVVGGSSGGVSDFPVDLNTTTGRVSWREIIGD